MDRLRLLVVTLLLLMGATARAETITIAADYWCPYNCDPSGKPEGYLIDLLRRVYEPQGIAVEYRLMAYPDALEAARLGKISGVPGVAADDAPELAYPKIPVGTSAYAFAYNKSLAFAYDGVDSLKRLRLGVIADYSYSPEIDLYIASAKGTPAVTVVAGETATHDLLTLLAEGKVDVIVEDELVLIYSLGQLSMGGLFELAALPGAQEIHVAFAPNDPRTPERVRMLEEGVAVLRANGGLAEILRAYGLRDWKR